MQERWKNIKGYEGFYQVSNRGRVKSLKKWDVNKRDYTDHETILNPTDNGYGYLIIGLRSKTHKKNHYVHRLVAEAFIENPEGKDVVNHLDYDKHNNSVENLEWCSQRDNVNYSREKMCHPRLKPMTNTGERYISRRSSTGKYRVTVNRKEYATFDNLQDAIKRRDEILREVMPYVEVNNE